MGGEDEKKTIGIFVAIVILFVSVNPALTKDYNQNNEINYIASVLERYLCAINNSNGEVYISQPFRINCREGRERLYLIANERNCVGELLVGQSDEGIFYSSFYSISNQTLDKWIYSGTPIAFFLQDGELVVQGGNDCLELNENTEYRTVWNKDNFPQTIVSLSRIDTAFIAEKDYQERSEYDCYLPLTIIPNHPLNGGLCWSACCAMLGKYRASGDHSALSLYYALKNIHGGTPSGNNPWYRRAFALFGLSYHEYTRRSFMQLFQILSSGCPIIFSMRYYWNSNQSGHDIVLRGLEGGNEYAIYSFADPNFTNGYLYVAVTDISGSSFTIITNSGTYNYWSGTRY